MDGVIVDFQSAFPKIDKQVLEKDINHPDHIEGIFSLMEPKSMAIKAVEFLSKHFDIYILSTASWENPSAWSDKLEWIKRYLPVVALKRLILTHNKHLNIGDYLIDDRIKNGASEFKGEFIHFEKSPFEGWPEVIQHLCKKENIDMPILWKTKNK
jgi:5'(3')-deoxyribonucleotidase